MKRNPLTDARDRGLRLISRVNRWLVAGAVALAGLFSVLAAHSFDGHTSTAATISRTTSSGSSGSRSPSSGSSASTSSGSGLSAPTSSPSSTSGSSGQGSTVVSGGS